MSLESNKKAVVDFYKALEQGDYDTVATLCHKDFVFYSQIDTARSGVDAFVAAEKKHLIAYNNIRMQVHCIAEDDRVAAYVVFEGDQVGDFYGVPPRGAHLRMSMGNFFRMLDGKIVEKRAHYDRMDHIEQLRAGSK